VRESLPCLTHAENPLQASEVPLTSCQEFDHPFPRSRIGRYTIDWPQTMMGDCYSATHGTTVVQLQAI